jgi:hypothetical protein
MYESVCVCLCVCVRARARVCLCVCIKQNIEWLVDIKKWIWKITSMNRCEEQ